MPGLDDLGVDPAKVLSDTDLDMTSDPSLCKSLANDINASLDNSLLMIYVCYTRFIVDRTCNVS